MTEERVTPLRPPMIDDTRVVASCARCGHHHIAYNCCKTRHRPKCRGPAARDWMKARAEDLLPVEHFHVVFTLPREIAKMAYWNMKAI